VGEGILQIGRWPPANEPANCSGLGLQLRQSRLATGRVAVSDLQKNRRYARIDRKNRLSGGGKPEKPMSSAAIKHVTDASFESDVLSSDKPVLVDYWAEWCGPCKMIAPILDEVSKDYGDRLQIAKMNVDENQGIPNKFGIRGIPTLMLFKGGELVATKVGALPKAQLTAFIDSHL
jgi:thioredoxin 1